MELKKMHWLGIIFGVILISVGTMFFLMNDEKQLFYFLLGLGVAVIALPFIVSLITESTREEELNRMFLEFSRNLAESVVTGTPISKSIVNVSKKNYGALTHHIVKLSNQIELGIPVNQAFRIFAKDIDNNVIS